MSYRLILKTIPFSLPRSLRVERAQSRPLLHNDTVSSQNLMALLKTLAFVVRERERRRKKMRN